MNANTATIMMLIGAGLPVLVSIVHQQKFPRWVNIAIAFGSSAIAGGIVVWARGDVAWTWPNLLLVVGVIFTETQVFFAAYWRASPLVVAIDAKTTIGSSTEGNA